MHLCVDFVWKFLNRLDSELRYKMLGACAVRLAVPFLSSVLEIQNHVDMTG